MKDRELKKYLEQSLGQETVSGEESFHNAKLDETIGLCAEVMRKQKFAAIMPEEPRTGFIQYLSDILHFEGLSVFGLQAVALFLVCLVISIVDGIPEYIPVLTPLFVLAVVPSIFRCQYYGMSEMEAATKASGAQIVLAKLVLAGAANLVCMTISISLSVFLQNAWEKAGQMVLYCLVPYLFCMVSMLRLCRLHGGKNIQICAGLMLGFCACLGVLAKTAPWLYETSAFGLWIAAFLFFAAFFIKEIYFIIAAGKEGKMYGIIA